MSAWVWMPHPAHLIVANYCRFHLATCVGKYIVSTVGEYVPSETSREIHAQVHGVTLYGKGDDREDDFLNKVGFVEIGAGHTYETMVFRAKKGRTACCPFVIANGGELDMLGYKDAGAAYRGHIKLCAQWAVTP